MKLSNTIKIITVTLDIMYFHRRIEYSRIYFLTVYILKKSLGTNVNLF